MIKFDNILKENIKIYNLNQPQISKHSDRILIIGDSGCGKTNALFNLVS